MQPYGVDIRHRGLLNLMMNSFNHGHLRKVSLLYHKREYPLMSSSIVQIAIFIGPWIVPRALAFYRSIRSASKGPDSSVRNPPRKVQRCLNVLYAAVVVSIVLSFIPSSNIFKETGSRLALPSNLLTSRIGALRNGVLTGTDRLFLEKIEHEPEKWRLLYAAYGPDVALKCPFCQATEPQSYLYYALPAIAMSHLFHILLLGIITSSFFSGPEGARWRTQATIAGVAIALIEFYMTWNYNWEDNASKRMLNEVDFFYQRMGIYRQLAFAGTDLLFGWMLWLTATNRWLVKPPTTTEQLAQLRNEVVASHAQVNLLANLRNAIVRDNELRAGQDRYWRREQEEMAAIMQDETVRNAVNAVLSHTDYDQTKRRADMYADTVLAQLKPDTAAKDER